MGIRTWIEQRRTTTVVIGPWEAGLVSIDGADVTLLSSGRHRIKAVAWYEVVDLRERLAEVSLQEVPTADGISIKVSLIYMWKVTDPVKFREFTASSERALHQSLQVALRRLVDQLPLEEAAGVLRGSGGASVLAAVSEPVQRYGIELSDVEVRDVLLPVEVRQAQASVLTARFEGQAKLEAARGETAALRALGNAAKMLADNPALAQLRLVQELPMGSTVELRP